MALGTTELTALMTLRPLTSTPLTSSTSSNSEASSTSTSRNMMGTLGGMWLSSRCSFSLWSYSALSPAGDDVVLALVAGVFIYPQRRLVEFSAVLPEFERAVDPRDQRDGNDGP